MNPVQRARALARICELAAVGDQESLESIRELVRDALVDTGPWELPSSLRFATLWFSSVLSTSIATALLSEHPLRIALVSAATAPFLWVAVTLTLVGLRALWSR